MKVEMTGGGMEVKREEGDGEQHFSLTKHFPAYLQKEGGEGAQAGT